MSFCTKCGNKLDTGDQFCPRCGQRAETAVSGSDELVSEWRLLVDWLRASSAARRISAAALAALGAMIAGYLINLALVETVAGLLSQSSDLGARTAGAILGGTAPKLAGLNLFASQLIRMVASGNLRTVLFGFQGVCSGSFVQPMSLSVLIPIASLAVASGAAAVLQPVSGRQEIVRRGLAIGTAYAVLMVLFKPLFTIGTGDLQFPHNDIYQSLAFELAPGFISTLLHAALFGVLFGIVGTWTMSRRGRWRAVSAGYLRGDDGVLPDWAHSALVSFLAAWTALLVVVAIAAPTTAGRVASQQGTEPFGPAVAALNYAIPVAGNAYYLLIGAPLHADIYVSSLVSRKEGFWGTASLITGVRWVDSQSPYGGQSEALPWYIYLGVPIPVTALVAGGWLAARRNRRRGRMLSVCARFGAAHAGLLLVLLPAYRLTCELQTSGGFGEVQAQAMNGVVLVGPTALGALIAGFTVAFLASLAGAALYAGGSQGKKAFFCPQCGSRVEGRASFCPHCGAKV